MPREPTIDPWSALRNSTSARIGLRRSGDAPALAHVLELQAAHAAARDAVGAPLDPEALERALAPLPSVRVSSRAPDRSTYLRRPDLGRRLEQSSLDALPSGSCEIVFVLADGLSALAVQRHAVPLLKACLSRLPAWPLAPVVIAEQARVALGDEIGEKLGAMLCAMLIGERPGLSVADSLGVYLTWEPRVGRRDHERNCISNVHSRGLGYIEAGERLAWLLQEALRRKLTGIHLKETALVRRADDATIDRGAEPAASSPCTRSASSRPP